MLNYLIIICHFLSDWVLQPRSIAKNKSVSIEAMLKHIAIIYVTFSILGFFYGVHHGLIVFNAAMHAVCDLNIWTAFREIRGPFTEEYIEKNLYADDYWFYFCIAVDQTIHLCILFWVFSLP